MGFDFEVGKKNTWYSVGLPTTLLFVMTPQFDSDMSIRDFMC